MRRTSKGWLLPTAGTLAVSLSLGADPAGVAVDQAAADWQVWTVSETRRVLRDEPASDRTSVQLAAARNMSYWSDVEDPWTDPGTLDRRERNEELLYNGEGRIVYPGRAVGYDGIAPSLRLKALRDAIEDYEYLAILERLGFASQAEEIILPLAGSWFQWETDPAAYETARAKLAELIVASER